MEEECCQCGREIKDNEAYSVYADADDLEESKICHSCYKEILDNTEGKCNECGNNISKKDINLIITVGSLIVLNEYTDKEEEDVFVCSSCADKVRDRITTENGRDFDSCLSLIVTVAIVAIVILTMKHFGWL